MNVLAACTFDLKFCYVLAGWEGSACDATVLQDALRTDLKIPQGKRYLADTGYPYMPGLLVPFWSTRYHLKEWERSRER